MEFLLLIFDYIQLVWGWIVKAGYFICALAIIYLVYRRYLKYKSNKIIIDREKLNPSNIPDVPKSFGYQSRWLAIPAEDNLAILIKVLGDRKKAIPANWESGLVAIKYNHDYVFVTPPVNGWFFIVGNALGKITENRKKNSTVFRIMKSLSKKVSKVFYFANNNLTEYYAWAHVENSKIVRAYAVSSGDEIYSKGELTSEEAVLMLEYVIAYQEDGMPIFFPTKEDVIKLAEEWSLNPMTLDQYSEEKGCGVLIKWD